MSFDPKDWTGLDNTNIGEGRILSATTVRALYENLIASFQGAAGAPRVASGALQDASVGTSQIKFGSNSVSGDVGSESSLNINMNDFSLFPSIGGNGALRVATKTSSGSTGDPSFRLVNTSGTTIGYSIAWRFLSS